MKNISTVITDHGTIEVWIATGGYKSYKCEFTPEDAAELITILPQAIEDSKTKNVEITKVHLEQARAKVKEFENNLVRLQS